MTKGTVRRNGSRFSVGTVLMGLGLVLSAWADTSAPVPLDHEVYVLLDRLQAQGTVRQLAGGMRPASERQVFDLLEIARKQQGIGELDRQRIELALAEFAPNTPDPGLNLSRPWVAPPLLKYRAEQGWLELDLLARQQTDQFSGRRDEREWVLRNRLGAVVGGQLGSDVGFRVSFEQIREEGVNRQYWIRSDVYEPRREAVQLKGGVADYHEATATVSFGIGKLVDVVAGKSQVMWGPAPDDNLGLSANAPSYDMILMKSRLGRLRFEHLAARLRPCPDRPDAPICGDPVDAAGSYIVNGMTRRLERDKYLAAHRLEISPQPWLVVGFQEVVIYGDRGPELAYLNPFMFYWAAQSYLGDKDNVMMTADVEFRPRPGLKLYAAYTIDDLKKLKIFTDDFANKFSLQAGMLWTDPLGLANTDLHGDYVRIEPWIYTHKFPINTFRHFDAPLGHALGPNSDRWRVSLHRRWHRLLATRLTWSYARHGDNELLADGSIRNVGGDLHLGWRPGDERDSKDFLDGLRTIRHTIGVGLDWTLLPRLRAAVDAEWEEGTDVPLAPRWQQGVPLDYRTGYGDGRQFHVAIDLRYGLL